MKQSSWLMQNSSWLMQNSSCLMKQSSWLMQNSSWLMQNSSWLMQNPSWLMQNPSCLMKQSSFLSLAVGIILVPAAAHFFHVATWKYISVFILKSSTHWYKNTSFWVEIPSFLSINLRSLWQSDLRLREVRHVGRSVEAAGAAFEFKNQHFWSIHSSFSTGKSSFVYLKSTSVAALRVDFRQGLVCVY